MTLFYIYLFSIIFSYLLDLLISKLVETDEDVNSYRIIYFIPILNTVLSIITVFDILVYTIQITCIDLCDFLDKYKLYWLTDLILFLNPSIKKN